MSATTARLIPLVAFAIIGFGACQSSSDLSVGRPYACDPAASDTCPGGWVCGLDGVCHPPAPGAWACRSSEDCFGWHCGVPDGGVGVCYDRSRAGEISCRRELDADLAARDCADGHRCTPDGICHDLDAGRSWACASDEDCGVGFRCSVLQPFRCVASASEGLVPRAPPSLDASIYVLAGGEVGAGVEPFSLSRPFVPSVGPFEPPPPAPPRTLAVARDGGVFVATIETYGAGETAGELLSIAPPFRAAGALTGRVLISDAKGLRTWVPAGGVMGPPSPEPGATQYIREVALRSGEEAALIGGGRELLLLTANGEARLDIPGDGGAPLNQDLSARLSMSSDPLALTTSLFALTNEGVYFASLAGSTPQLLGLPDAGPDASRIWAPLHLPGLPHARCVDAGVFAAAPRTVSIAAIQPVPPPGVTTFRPGFAVAQRAEDGGVWLRWYQPAAQLPNLSCTARFVDAGQFAPCADGEELRWMLPDLSNAPAGVAVSCAADGGLERIDRLQFNPTVDGGLDRFSLATSAATLPSRTSGFTGFLDGRGVPWDCHDAAGGKSSGGEPMESPAASPEGFTSGNCRALVSVSAPQWAVGPGTAGLWVQEAEGLYGDPSPLGLRLLAAAGHAACGPIGGDSDRFIGLRWGGGGGFGAGGLSIESRTQPLGAVPAAVLADSSDVAAFGHCPGTREAHPFGARLEDASGSPWWSIAAKDRIWFGRADRAPTPLPDGGTLSPTLPVRNQPLPYGQISSLVLYATGADSLFEGYVLSSERLFALRVETEVRWRSSEISLPAGTPMAVWADGVRGRVGFTNGRVYSLPNVVPLSTPLEAGVQSYAELCGITYALTQEELLRLDASAAGGVGAWTPIDVPSLQSGATARFAGGLLHRDGASLYLLDGAGSALRLFDASCAP